MGIRRAPKVADRVKLYEPGGDPLGLQYPTLISFLTLMAWEDGARRETGSLMLVWEEGWFKAWLNDRDGQRTAWLSGESLSSLLSHVEAQLDADRVQWRTASPQARRK